MGFISYRDSTNEALLNEANTALISEDFKESDLQKVGTLLSKLATKKLSIGKGTFIYKEKFKKDSGETGIGAVFIFEKNVIMRYNYLNKTKKGYSVNSIDYWKNAKLGDNPTKSISFAGENIVQLQEKLFDYLANGNLDESTDGAYKSFDELVETSGAEKKEQREVWAAKNGIKISYANSYSLLKRTAIKQGLENEFYAALGGNITVKSNISETTSTQKTWNEDQKMLGEEGIFADPKYVFQDMEESAKLIAQGKWRSLIVAGDGGLGKTFGIKQVMTQMLGPYGEGPGSKWAYYGGLNTSPFGLFKILLTNKDKIIVFDDSDAIWGNTDMENMIKKMTEDDGNRYIEYSKNSTANVALMDQYEREQYTNDYIESLTEDPNTKMKPPSKFLFTGALINISNMKPDKFDGAVKTRSIFINLFLARRDVLRRLATIGAFQGDSEEEISEILSDLDPNFQDALDGKGKYGGEIRYLTPEDNRKTKKLSMRSYNLAKAFRAAGVKDRSRMISMYA